MARRKRASRYLRLNFMRISSENGAPASSRAGFTPRPAREDAGAPPDFHCFRASQRHVKTPPKMLWQSGQFAISSNGYFFQIKLGGFLERYSTSKTAEINSFIFEDSFISRIRCGDRHSADRINALGGRFGGRLHDRK